MTIRKYEATDLKQIIELFYNTVHSVTSKDYSEEQLNVWATGNVDSIAWNKSFLQHYSIVAQKNGIIVGFGDIDGDYLDRLYVHKDYQSIGIATAITDALEKYAVTNSKIKVTTHSSITAKPFFENRGYRVIKEQQVERNKIFLTNFIMEKVIA